MLNNLIQETYIFLFHPHLLSSYQDRVEKREAYRPSALSLSDAFVEVEGGGDWPCS